MPPPLNLTPRRNPRPRPLAISDFGEVMGAQPKSKIHYFRSTGSTGHGFADCSASGLLQVKGACWAADIQSRRLARVMAT